METIPVYLSSLVPYETSLHYANLKAKDKGMLNELLRNAAFSAVYRLPMIQRISNIAEEHIQYDSLYFLHKSSKKLF